MTYFAPGSRPGLLVFRTSVLGSGPRLTVALTERAPSTIEATITTGGTFALTGWGRGQTTANRLLPRAHCTDRARRSPPVDAP